MHIAATEKPCPIDRWLKSASAAELARKSGVNAASLSDWLNRKARLRRASLDAIAKATGVDVAELLLWQEQLLHYAPPMRPRTRRVG